jgi:hypothetical protein
VLVWSDIPFRKTTLDFEAEGAGSFAPFNRFRIRQDYEYEDGRLEETVELYKKKDALELPAFTVEESATLFAERKFTALPSRIPPL